MRFIWLKKSNVIIKSSHLKGYGPGVYEIATEYDKNAYRAVYIVNVGEIIYVVHAFQKKSKHGN